MRIENLKLTVEIHLLMKDREPVIYSLIEMLWIKHQSKNMRIENLKLSVEIHLLMKVREPVIYSLIEMLWIKIV